MCRILRWDSSTICESLVPKKNGNFSFFLDQIKASHDREKKYYDWSSNHCFYMNVSGFSKETKLVQAILGNQQSSQIKVIIDLIMLSLIMVNCVAEKDATLLRQMRIHLNLLMHSEPNWSCFIAYRHITTETSSWCEYHTDITSKTCW